MTLYVVRDAAGRFLAAFPELQAAQLWSDPESLLRGPLSLTRVDLPPASAGMVAFVFGGSI